MALKDTRKDLTEEQFIKEVEAHGYKFDGKSKHLLYFYNIDLDKNIHYEIDMIKQFGRSLLYDLK
jgi:hypothetical protein